MKRFKKFFLIAIAILFTVSFSSCNRDKSSSELDGVYRFYLWYSNEEDMCFEFIGDKLNVFAKSAPDVIEEVTYTNEDNIITLVSEAGQTLKHEGDYLYYTAFYFEADLGDSETFDLEADMAGYDFFHFKKDGTCEFGVISPGGFNEVYGSGKYVREGNLLKMSFEDTYPYEIAEESFFYYEPEQGRVYVYLFIKE